MGQCRVTTTMVVVVVMMTMMVVMVVIVMVVATDVLVSLVPCQCVQCSQQPALLTLQ